MLNPRSLDLIRGDGRAAVALENARETSLWSGLPLRRSQEALQPGNDVSRAERSGIACGIVYPSGNVITDGLPEGELRLCELLDVGDEVTKLCARAEGLDDARNPQGSREAPCTEGTAQNNLEHSRPQSN